MARKWPIWHRLHDHLLISWNSVEFGPFLKVILADRSFDYVMGWPFDPEANGTCDISHTFEGELQEYSIES